MIQYLCAMGDKITDDYMKDEKTRTSLPDKLHY